jgi:hypothetical protein
MIKLLRNAPWFFLYVVLLSTNSAAMDDRAAAEAQKLIIWRQIQGATLVKNAGIYKRAHNKRNQNELVKSYANGMLFSQLNNLFEMNIAQGKTPSAAARISLSALNRPFDPPLTPDVKRDMRLCFDDSCSITQS